MIFARCREYKNALRITKNIKSFKKEFSDLIICKRFDSKKSRNKERIEILLKYMNRSGCRLIAREVKDLFDHGSGESHPPAYIGSGKKERGKRACSPGHN